MTRIVIFGDLHANWEALQALQQAEPHPDVALCLGDIVGYGPDPKRCLDSVRVAVPHIVGGRHDHAIGQGALQNSGVNELEATWAHARSVLPASDREFLSELPASKSVKIAGVHFYLTRLEPDDSGAETQMLITMSQAQLRKQFDGIDADIILLGGPHIPAMRQIDNRLIVCPGSLGLPRYGVSDPTFAAWQDGRMQIHHLHYHPDTTIKKMSLLPLDPEYILRLQSILQTGGLE